MADYKRQHTVTKWYLERFLAEDGAAKLCQYEKQTLATCVVDCKDATVGKYIYSFQHRDGSWNHQGEKFLSEIEGAAVPLLSALEAGEHLAELERYQIGLFIAAMVRRPRAIMDHFLDSFMEVANDPVRRMTHFEDMRPELERRYTLAEIENARVQIEGGALDWSTDAAKAGLIRAWFKQLPRYAAAISGMYWTVWHAPKGHDFLTSDAPAIVRRECNDSDPGVVGVMRRDLKAELTLPISKKALLIARHTAAQPAELASKARVRELNARIIRMAHRFIFGGNRNETVLTLIKQNCDFKAPLPALTWSPQAT